MKRRSTFHKEGEDCEKLQEQNLLKKKHKPVYQTILEALEDEGFQTDESMRDVEFDDIKSQNISEDSDEQKGNEDNDHECSHQKNSASKTKAREIFQKQ